MQATEMRLLITSFDYRPRIGGVAAVAFELARALHARPDVEVRLLAPRVEGGEEFDRAQGIPVSRVSLAGSTLGSIAPMAAHLGREVAAWKPDAVVNLLWLPDGAASLLCAPLRAALGIPYYVFAHGVELVESDRNLRKRLRSALVPLKRAVFRQARGIFAVSRYAGQLASEHCGVDADRVRVVFNGVDPLWFRPAAPAPDLVERLGLAGRRVFLTVSRLVDYKGIDRAIAALRHVVRQNPEALYLVCGDGPDLGRLEALARHYRVQDHVRFCGAVPSERLRDYYNLAEAHVLLSRTDWETPNLEGFGLVFLEAAACGKPSIAGDSGGIGDAVEPGRSGWLVDPNDERAVAAVMREALENPARTRALGASARQRVLEGFTWGHMAERLMEKIRRDVRD